jgi:hypothetical protein
MRMLAPMVMMTRLRGLAFLRGLMARRSKTMPTAVETTTASKTANTKGG